MTAISKRWTQSYSGRVVTPAFLQPDQVQFEDIPHTLCQKVRFNGHLRELGYSVAQHCVLGARLIADKFKLAFLLHEASEVYLPDIPSPIKPLLTIDIGDKRVAWEDLEDQHAHAVFEHLGLLELLPLIYSPEVKQMDLEMLMTEKRDLAGPEPKPWGIDVLPRKDLKINRVWNMASSKLAFTTMYEELLELHRKAV